MSAVMRMLISPVAKESTIPGDGRLVNLDYCHFPYSHVCSRGVIIRGGGDGKGSTMPGKAAGLVVSPSVIMQYGASIGEQESELTSIQALLSATPLSGDAFGKLPEAGDLYRAYTEHAAVIGDVMNKVPGNVDKVAQALLATGQTYAELERGMSEGISHIFGPPGTGGYQYSAPSSTGGQMTTGFATILDDSASAYGWIFAPESNLPALGIQNLAPPSNDWLGNYIQEAVDFVLTHLPVLSQLLDYVTGNYAQLKQAAADWHTAGVRTLGVVRALKPSAAELPRTWGGAASAEFGRFMGGVTGALEELASVMGQTQKIIEDAAAEANFAQQTISMIISEVIEWVAANIAIDILTAGLATGIEALASAGFIIRKVEEAEQAVGKLASAYRAMGKLLQGLAKIGEADKGFEALKKAEGLEKFGKFFELGKTFTEGLKVGTVANLRFLGDGKLAGAAVKAFDVAGRGLADGDVEKITKLGADGMAYRIGVNAVMSAAGELTGLPANTGLVGLGQDMASGTISDLENNGQGAADAAGAGSPVPEGRPVSRIAAMLNPDKYPPPKEH